LLSSRGRLWDNAGQLGAVAVAGFFVGEANIESLEIFDIIKPDRRVKIKGYRQ